MVVTVVLGFVDFLFLLLLYFGCRRLSRMTAGGIDDTLHELGLYTKHGILKLQEIWNDIGVSESEQAEKCESVISSLRSVLDSLVIGERAWKECLEEDCLQLLDCCNESNRALGLPVIHFDSVEMAVIPKRDYFVAKDLDLKDKIETMKQEIEFLEDRKTACIMKLGLQPDHHPSIQSDNISRVVSLLDLQIKEFEEDMARRTVRLNEQLTELCSLVDSLEIDRNGLIEEGLLSEDDPDSLTLSNESMQRRGDLIAKYRTEKQDKISLSTDLSEKICRLHRLLHKDALPEDAQIRAQFYCPKPSSISRLQEHLDGQNQEKQGKLDAYVAGIKQEIDELQKLCFQSRCEVSSSEDTSNTRETSDLKTSSTDTIDLPDITLDNIEHNNSSNTVHSSRDSLILRDSVFSRENSSAKSDIFTNNVLSTKDDESKIDSNRDYILSKDNASDPIDRSDDISKKDGVSLVYGVSNVDDASNLSSVDNISILGNISEADNVSQLEDELETWESFYKSNRDMFEMIRKWKDLNERFYELEAPSPDKYNNRGGALLQSQKEAAKISKEIPKIENKVLTEIDKMVGEEIRINGLHPEDYFLENRAATSLSRMNSARRSRKKTDKSPAKSPTEERLRTRTNSKGGSFGKKRDVVSERPTPEHRNSVNKRSIRRRISKESGLDKVGIK